MAQNRLGGHSGRHSILEGGPTTDLPGGADKHGLGCPCLFSLPKGGKGCLGESDLPLWVGHPGWLRGPRGPEPSWPLKVGFQRLRIPLRGARSCGDPICPDLDGTPAWERKWAAPSPGRPVLPTCQCPWPRLWAAPMRGSLSGAQPGMQQEPPSKPPAGRRSHQKPRSGSPVPGG